MFHSSYFQIGLHAVLHTQQFSRYYTFYGASTWGIWFLISYSTLNKITQFWLVESSTINPKLYSVGVPIKFPWKRRNFVECTINKKSHGLLVRFVNDRYSWFSKFSNCTRLKACAILRTIKITLTYKSCIVPEVMRFPIHMYNVMFSIWPSFMYFTGQMKGATGFAKLTLTDKLTVHCLGKKPKKCIDFYSPVILCKSYLYFVS